MTTHTVIAALLVALFLVLSEHGHRRRRRAASRARLIGGYVKPPASDPMKDGGPRTPETAITALISSYSPPGSRLAVRSRMTAQEGSSLALRRRLQQNRPTVPGSFGNVTVVPGKNGARDHSVDCPSLGCELPLGHDGKHQKTFTIPASSDWTGSPEQWKEWNRRVAEGTAVFWEPRDSAA